MLARVSIALLITVSMSAAAAQAQPSPVAQRVFCGGETDVATVERYFSELRAALATTGSNTRFNKFVASPFSIRDRRGRSTYFDVSSVRSVTPGYITVRDWEEISRRGATSLQNAGWRGCFMDLGKVWFEGSKEDGFRLAGIARDMRWRQPEKGDALP